MGMTIPDPLNELSQKIINWEDMLDTYEVLLTMRWHWMVFTVSFFKANTVQRDICQMNPIYINTYRSLFWGSVSEKVQEDLMYQWMLYYSFSEGWEKWKKVLINSAWNLTSHRPVHVICNCTVQDGTLVRRIQVVSRTSQIYGNR